MWVQEEATWIEQNFSQARNARPSAQLAVLWSGIEGLFAVESEIVFRLSLYIARYIAPNDEIERRRVFIEVKHLYKQRSAAVHGSEIKGDANSTINESAQLLLRILRQCVTDNNVPCIEKLAP